MRLHLMLAAPALALALSACTGGTAEAPAPDPAVIKAEADKAVAEALAARDAEGVKPHGDAGPAVYFVNLRDGQFVPQSFRVVFGVYGIGVAPALTDKPNTAHHHLLIDTEMTAEEMQYAIVNEADTGKSKKPDDIKGATPPILNPADDKNKKTTKPKPGND